MGGVEIQEDSFSMIQSTWTSTAKNTIATITATMTALMKKEKEKKEKEKEKLLCHVKSCRAR